MTSPSDQLLAEQVRQGNEQAFVHLIRRYERTLVGLIRHRVGPGDQVQDVLQETLVHIWSGLRRDTPRDVRAWLLQVARNRCRDYFRSTQRRELFVETEVLTPMVNRFGVAQARQREAAAAIVEAMEEVPDRERAALQAFYLDGLSIAEIAARHRCPDGTVKRRLSHGRDRIRTVLGVTPKTRSKTMSASQQQSFPQYRPEIRIEASQEEPFRIDFKEMAWWFIVPEVGDRVRYGSYGPPKENDAPWRLSETVSLMAQRPAIIHDRPCVEIEVENQHLTAMKGDNVPNKKKDIRVKVWGCLAENAVEWIAVESLRPDGTHELTTFLDEGFYDDWDSSPRLIEDCGCLRPQADGSLARQADAPEVMGAGVFDVQIGRQRFTCLRVFEIEKEASERDVMVEAYITRAGRTVLFRRYNGNRWAKRDTPPHNWGEEMTWEEDLPHTDRIVIDGVTYVHYYDNLTDMACGIAD